VGLELIEAPDADDPVATWEEASVQVRSEDPGDKALLEELVAAATGMAQGYTRRAFVAQKWRLTQSAFVLPPAVCDPLRPSRAAITLPIPPLVSVESVKYIDVDGVLQTLDPAKYTMRKNVTPGEIVRAYAAEWPSTRAVDDAVQVEFTCGYGEAVAVPAAIKRAVLLIVGTLYRNRENVVTGTIATEIPQSAQWLLSRYRVARLGA